MGLILVVLKTHHVVDLKEFYRILQEVLSILVVHHLKILMEDMIAHKLSQVK